MTRGLTGLDAAYKTLVDIRKNGEEPVHAGVKEGTKEVASVIENRVGTTIGVAASVFLIPPPFGEALAPIVGPVVGVLVAEAADHIPVTPDGKSFNEVIGEGAAEIATGETDAEAHQPVRHD